MPSRGASRAHIFAITMVVYAAFVLVVDCLATRGVRWPFDWRSLYWLQVHDAGEGYVTPGADYFKLIFWLIVPIILCVWTFDRSWFRIQLESKADRWILGGLALAGVMAVLAVPLIPALRTMYPSLSFMPGEVKLVFAFHYGVWIATWLTGWEFLHRYAIPRAMVAAWPNRAFLVCIVIMPILEGGYHVAQGKHWLECLGMAAFSAVLTAWAVSRRNALYPFLAHLLIEVALVALMLLV